MNKARPQADKLHLSAKTKAFHSLDLCHIEIGDRPMTKKDYPFLLRMN